MRGSTHRWPAICLTAMMAMMLSACNGNQGSIGGTASNVVPPVQTGPMGDSLSAWRPKVLSNVNIYPGEVVGTDNMFKPADGDTRIGGQGKKMGKIPCDPTEYLNDYHIHAYVGVIYKGRQIAVPDAIGMVHPGPEQNGYITTAGCYYFIHTHDASGMIHLEFPNNLPPSATPYTFASFLKIWGVKYTKTNFGRFRGTVRVFVGNVPSLGQTKVTSYAPLQKATMLSTTPIRSHEAFWIEIGKPFYPASQLPSVTFYTEY
jgi:hypothetical protein